MIITIITLPEANNERVVAVNLITGEVELPAGAVLKGAAGASLVIGQGGGTVNADGEVRLPAGGSATLNSIEIKTARGGLADTAGGSLSAPVVEIGGIIITAPAGGEVTTDRFGRTLVAAGATLSRCGGGMEITVGRGEAALDQAGNLTFVRGGRAPLVRTGGGLDSVNFELGGQPEQGRYCWRRSVQ